MTPDLDVLRPSSAKARARRDCFCVHNYNLGAWAGPALICFSRCVEYIWICFYFFILPFVFLVLFDCLLQRRQASDRRPSAACCPTSFACASSSIAPALCYSDKSTCFNAVVAVVAVAIVAAVAAVVCWSHLPLYCARWTAEASQKLHLPTQHSSDPRIALMRQLRPAPAASVGVALVHLQFVLPISCLLSRFCFFPFVPLPLSFLLLLFFFASIRPCVHL